MKKNNFILLILILISVSSEAAKSQSYAGEGATVEPTMLIDKPTAGLLKRGSYSVS